MTEPIPSTQVIHGLKMQMICIPPLWFCHCGATFDKSSLFHAHLQESEVTKP